MPLINLKKSLFYATCLFIVFFALCRAQDAVEASGKLSSSETLALEEIKTLISKAKVEPKPQTFLEETAKLRQHAHYQESDDLIIARLKKLEATNTQERIYLLVSLAKNYSRTSRFKDAERALEQAYALSNSTNSSDSLLIVDELVNLYGQRARFSRSKKELSLYSRKLDYYIQAANQLANKSAPTNENLERLIRNHSRIGLIECGRLLELDCFDPEAGSMRRE